MKWYQTPTCKELNLSWSIKCLHWWYQVDVLREVYTEVSETMRRILPTLFLLLPAFSLEVTYCNVVVGTKIKIHASTQNLRFRGDWSYVDWITRALFSCASAQHDFGEWMLPWGSQVKIFTLWFCIRTHVLLWFPPAILNFAGLRVRWAQPAEFSPSLWHCPCARTTRGRSMGWQCRNQGSICTAFVCTEGSHAVRNSQLDSFGWSPVPLNGSSNSQELEHAGESGQRCSGFVVEWAKLG